MVPVPSISLLHLDELTVISPAEDQNLFSSSQKAHSASSAPLPTLEGHGQLGVPKNRNRRKVAAFNISEAWGPPQFQEKRSRSERAILGALGEFRGILGAALGIGNSILGIRNSILGMASHDLINTKPTILGATLGAIPGIAANPPERFSFAPAFSERFFKNWGGPRAPEYCKLQTSSFTAGFC